MGSESCRWIHPGYNSTLSAWARGTLWREPLALLRKLCQVDAVSHAAFILALSCFGRRLELMLEMV